MARGGGSGVGRGAGRLFGGAARRALGVGGHTPASAAPSAGATPGGALSNTAGESPAEVALQLEALLGQHSVLVADMMRSRIRGDDDFAQAASAAVTRNADDLTAVVKAMFGAQAATAFHSTWTDHTAAFYNYARSLATGDTGARERLRPSSSSSRTASATSSPRRRRGGCPRPRPAAR